MTNRYIRFESDNSGRAEMRRDVLFCPSKRILTIQMPFEKPLTEVTLQNFRKQTEKQRKLFSNRDARQKYHAASQQLDDNIKT